MVDNMRRNDEEKITQLTEPVEAENVGTRVDVFLAGELGLSRANVQKLISEGNIFSRKKQLKTNYKVKVGDIFELMPQEAVALDAQPENIPLDIVYEDEELLIVNKKPGMVVHPGHGNWSGTLVNALAYHFDQLPTGRNGAIRPGLVHRIDKDTSGLLVIAKTEYAMTHLAKQFYDHSIERTYYALIWGELKLEKGEIEGHIGRSHKDRRVMQVFPDGAFGKEAKTHYEVMKAMRYVSWVKLNLETGRSHQIRAHMKYIGHPLFNDATYGGDKILKGTTFAKFDKYVENCFEICPRQALHAKSLGFIHPKTKKFMQFESELPDDLAHLLSKWENYVQGA